MLRATRRAAAAAFTALLALALAAVAAVAVLSRADVVRFATVLTGSMEPVVGAGSVIAGTPLAGEEVRVGDVVMFVPPEPYDTYRGKPVVHRVIEASDEGGALQVRTQGDANSNPDPWTLDARRTTFYEYRGQSAVLGALVQSAPGVSRQLLWTIPILLLVLHALRRIWQSGPAHVPKHAAGRSRAGSAAAA